MLQRLLLACLTTFAVALLACGDDGDGGNGKITLPPTGEQRFSVTGTMEVELPQEGVSGGPSALQQTETGDVSGGLTSVFNEDGSFTISELGITVNFGERAIEITQGDQPSTGNVGPGGTTMSLSLEATLDSNGPATSDTPVELESSDTLGVDSSATLSTPEGAAPTGFTPRDSLASQSGFLIQFVLWKIEQERREEIEEALTQDAQLDDLITDGILGEFTDEDGDEVFCDTGEEANDPAVDIHSVSVRETDGQVEVGVSLGQAPTKSNRDRSFAVEARFGQEGDYEVRGYQVHEGEESRGNILDTAGNYEEGTEDTVRIDDELIRFLFRTRQDATVAARSFHLTDALGMRTCDVTPVVPLSKLSPP